MSQVPKFASEAEEAEFWETHDVTEFLDDLPRESVTAHRGQVISVRVSQDDLDALKRLAAENGIGYTTVARMLIHRGIQAEMTPRRRAQRTQATIRRGRRPLAPDRARNAR
jgi:predicted DNA binding CopG/RHH family protein